MALTGLGNAESTFNMYGGTISNNTVVPVSAKKYNNTGSGAGVVLRGSTSTTAPAHRPVFNMYGGAISGNTATPNADGDRDTGWGGGIFAFQGEVNLYDGVIENNKAMSGGGVAFYYANFNFYGGTIRGNTASWTGTPDQSVEGGGIYTGTGCEIYMGPPKDGTADTVERLVTGNTVTGPYHPKGGGMSLAAAAVFHVEGVTVSGNAAVSTKPNVNASRPMGGGIALKGNTTTERIIKDCVISENHANWGAGISIDANTTTSVITIEGTAITGNGPAEGEQAYWDSMGGGISCWYNGYSGVTILNLKDCVIGGSAENANYAQYGGGIAVHDQSGSGGTKYKIVLENTQVTFNRAEEAGGGICVNHQDDRYDGSSEIVATTAGNVIASNTADVQGADICAIVGQSAKATVSISLPDAAGMGATYQDSGEAIDGWYQDVKDNRYTPSVDGVAETTITNLGAGTALVASYKAKPTHTITVTVTNGTANPAGPAITVTEGASQTITFTPDKGYELDSVTVDGQPAQLTDGKYTFTNVTGNHTIEVVYKQTYVPPPITYYYIDATAGEGGSISPSGRVPVVAGANAVFTITPEEGYRVADVLVDGQSVGAVSSYTFPGVRKNHTIQVTFIETEWVADPDDTGVSDWLVTDEHIAFLQGYGNGQFRPDGDMTRAEVAQMFYNLLRDKDVAITTSFTDVPDNRWFSKAVNTLASLGVLKGVGGNRFDPDAPITRAEFTAIAMRFTSAKVETATNPYTDVSPSNWYYEAVVGANAYGWIRGYGNGQFRPNNTITRAEVTAITNRMLGRVADRAYIDAHADELPVRFTDNPASGGWAYYNIVEATNEHTYQKGSGQQESWTGLVR